MMWYWGPAYGWGMTVIGILTMVAFWGGIFAVAILLIRGLAGPRVGQQDVALETLRNRLAAGEITSDEYDRIRKVLLG